MNECIIDGYNSFDFTIFVNNNNSHKQTNVHTHSAANLQLLRDNLVGCTRPFFLLPITDYLL